MKHERYPLELIRAYIACLRRVGFDMNDFNALQLELPAQAFADTVVATQQTISLAKAGNAFTALKSLTRDESYGFARQDTLNAGLTRLLWLSSLHRNSLGELLSSQYELARQYGSNFGFIMQTSANGCHYGFQRTEHDNDLPSSLLQRSDCNHLYWWYRVACWFVGELLPVAEVHIMGPDQGASDLLRSLFDCPLHFDAPFYGVNLDSEYLDLPVCRGDRDIRQLERGLGSACINVTATGTHSTSARILAMLAGDNNLMMEVAAQRLHCSRHTVVRRLREEGTTFQQLKIDFRMDRAKALLNDKETSIEAVSASLGFANPPAFTRAFRRYYGQPPSAFRPAAKSGP